MKSLNIGEGRELNHYDYIDEDTKSIECYFDDINEYDLLSDEEEKELAGRIQEGDKEALDTFVQANLRFVILVAKEYQYKGLSLADLIGFGNEGLIEAAKRFDHTKGFKFTTYAVWRIRSSIMNGLISEGLMVRLPGNRHQQVIEIERWIQNFLQEHNRMPKHAEISRGIEKIIGKKVEWYDILGPFGGHESLDAPIGEDEEKNLIDLTLEERFGDKKNEKTYLDILEDVHATKELLKSLSDESFNNEITQIIQKIKDRKNVGLGYYEEVLSSYYGLYGKKELELEEIGEKIGLPTERVRQIKQYVINKIRTEKRFGGKLKDYLG